MPFAAPRPARSAPPRLRLAGCAVALLLGASGAAVGAPAPALGERAAAQLARLAEWKRSRTPEERKIASVLLFALDRRAGRLPGELAAIAPLPLPDDGLWTVDLELAQGADPAAVAGALAAQGGRLVAPARGRRELRAELPAERLRELAGDAGVAHIVPPREAFTHWIASEGDRTLEADRARELYGLDGTGRKVCVLSDGVASLALSQEAGELPAVDVLPGQAGSGDEGTAMLEIVHDLAPGAELGFATAFGGVESFADNIRALAAAGCTLIVDDVIYLVESPFQDLAIAAAVDEVAAEGVLYLSSAGNEGNLDDGTSGTWEGDFAANGSLPPIPGLVLHDFGDGGVSDLVVDGAPAVTLHWTDPFGGSANDYDLFVLDGALSGVVRFSNDTQDGDDDPLEIVSFFGTGADPGERLVVGRSAGADRLFNLVAFRGELERATAGALRGHAAAAGAVAVAAVPAAQPIAPGEPSGPYPDPYDASQLSERFTSDGPRRIFFAPDGALLPGAPPGNFSSSGGVVRAKPDLAAADGVATSVEGFTRFFGTSAAAPHAAALAALLWSARPTWSAEEVRAALAASALDLEVPGPDRTTGAGVPQLVAALAAGGVPYSANLELVAVGFEPEVGNGDATPDPGESWRVRIRLRNVGGAAASALRATLTSAESAATVLQATVLLADLPPAEEVEADAFLVALAPQVDCGAILRFTLTVDYGGGIAPEEFAVALTVGAPGATLHLPYLGAPVAIPDAPSRGVPGPPALATIELPALGGRLVDLDFSLDGELCSTDPGATTVGVQHGFVANLRLVLVAPSGRALTLIRNTDGFGNNFCQTWLDDESSGRSIQSVETPDNPFSGSFTPARPLASFDGEEPAGAWTLEVTDWLPLDVGSVRAFALHPTPAVCRPFLVTVEIPTLSRRGAAALALLVAAAALAALVRARRR